MVIIKTQQQNLTPADNNIRSGAAVVACSICDRSDKVITDTESGEIICGNCGMVISDKVEDASHVEQHMFTQGGQLDETTARTGAPTSLARHDMGLATMVGKEDRDASGRK